MHRSWRTPHPDVHICTPYVQQILLPEQNRTHTMGSKFTTNGDTS